MMCSYRVLVLVVLLEIVYARYNLPLRKRNKNPDPNCKCTNWYYVDQCGADCRQLRWRDCEPSKCGVEDETVPCYSVEWDEWGSCDPFSCTRTRSQACMCLMRKVAPEICMKELESEVEECTREDHWTDWSECSTAHCKRNRHRQCECVDPGLGAVISIIRDEMCGIELSQKFKVETCRVSTQETSWSDCDANCLQRRTNTCRCEDPGTGGVFEVEPLLCPGFRESESQSCAKEWADWIHQEECPTKLPEGICTVFVRRFRNCNCVNVSDQRKFVVSNGHCGRGPFDQNVECNNIPERCVCSPRGGSPAVCQPTCDATRNTTAVGSDPECKCYPLWYAGTCAEEQMKPDIKQCTALPSQWNAWGSWGPEGCDGTCQQKRSRTCGCFDGQTQHPSDLSECEGENEETRNCETDWAEWYQKPCPKQQKDQCVVKTGMYRMCTCSADPSIKLGHARCEGEYFRLNSSCPLDPYGPCKCDWRPIEQEPCPDSCTATAIPGVEPACECSPAWYKGQCSHVAKPPVLVKACTPTRIYEWGGWGAWAACEATACTRTRTRDCSCQDDISIQRSDTLCGADNRQTETCPTSWGSWEGGCASPLCDQVTKERTRKCVCLANPAKYWEGEEALEEGRCAGQFHDLETCNVIPYDVTSWGDWSECEVPQCTKSKTRSCQCRDENGVRTDVTRCGSGTVYYQSEECDTEWGPWSEADCGVKTCVMKTRPKERECLCKEAECRLPRDRCEGKWFEIAVKCPFYPPEDLHCTSCQCTDWVCDESCTNAYIRTCDPPKCQKEVQYQKEECCSDDGAIEGGGGSSGTQPGADCDCSDWYCPATCTATMVRVCTDTESCEEEKEITQLCCDVAQCSCSEWHCKEVPDYTMVRECPPSCFILQEKPIAQLCVDADDDNEEEEEEEEEEEGGECSCSDWQEVGCTTTETGCTSEEWRVCLPVSIPPCGDEVRLITDSKSTCCGDKEEEDHIKCSTCRDWIDIGFCTGKAGTHQWRSIRNCDPRCNEFRCIEAAELQWIPFSKDSRADVVVDFSEMDMERIFVRYPCGDNIWFKLFISSGHIELFSKTKGNIFCKEGGTKNWYGGDRTDFTMDGVVCDDGGKYVMFVIEKTLSSLKIKNIGDTVVYEQQFDSTDGLCSTTPTTRIKTQVWNYDGSLDLSFHDNFFIQEQEGPADLTYDPDCSCSAWQDVTGCDDQCVNTETRQCNPGGCDSQYRIQSGFCCKK